MVRDFRWHALGPLVLLEGRVRANQYKVVLTDHLYPIMQYLHPNGSGLFTVPIHRTRGLTLNEYDDEANHMIWSLQLADNIYGRISGEEFDSALKPASSNHWLREYLLGEMCSFI